VLQVGVEPSEQQQGLGRAPKLLNERRRNSTTLTVSCSSEQQQEVQNGQVLVLDPLEKK